MCCFVCPPTIPGLVLPQFLRWRAGLLRLPTDSNGSGPLRRRFWNWSPSIARAAEYRRAQTVGVCTPAQQRNLPVARNRRRFAHWRPRAPRRITGLSDRSVNKTKNKVSPFGRCSRDSQTVGLSAFLPTFAARQKQAGGVRGREAPGLSNSGRSPWAGSGVTSPQRPSHRQSRRPHTPAWPSAHSCQMP